MKVNFLGDIGVFKKFEDLGIDPFKEVRLPDADMNIGNFEFIVAENPVPFFYDVQKRYSCSSAYLKNLKIEMFSGLSLANNHCLDYGPEGVQDTLGILEDKGITVFGYSHGEDYSVGAFEKDGIRLALIGCVKAGRWSREKHGFGPDSYDPVKIIEEIQKLKETFDHIVVFPHWGTELVEIPDHSDTVNAKLFLDSGASAVIGHHPHISQGIESYRDGIIAYSLGSFIYIPGEELGYSKQNPNRNISLCLNVDFGKNKINAFSARYYRYNPLRNIPEMLEDVKIKEYADFLDGNIYNHKLYRKQLRAVLLRREFKSFVQRFREKPLTTVYNYMGMLNPKKLKKLFSS